ncbi:MAG TPA: hypothetical protein VFT22_20910 [Kofleriaceae bacterium]|nr:hypothetical protein [Kofleriaceae bacterium]
MLTLVALAPMASTASAQPVDPYAPEPAEPAPKQAPAAPAPKQTPAPKQAPAPKQTPAPAGPTPKQTAAPAGPTASPAPAPDAPKPAPEAPKPAPEAPEAPQDPYVQVPAPSAPDPVLAERIAGALVLRAQELLDAHSYLDAKQLAVEALVNSPRGPSADKARAIIHAVNQQLGIPEDSPRPEAKPARPEDVDTSPIQDPTLSTSPVTSPPEGEPAGGWNARIAAGVHGGLYAGLLGTTIGAFFSSDTPAKGAVPVGLAVGVAGALAVPRLTERLHWTEAQTRTVGSATVWGGVIGGLFGDIAKTEGTTAREVLVAASVGSTIAGLGGYAVMRQHPLTRGDVALIDTLAGIGAAGGLTLGMLMQPAESEAYSLNSVIGIAGGVLAGYIAAPLTNTTPRRMLRVAGLAAAGGAAPFLLYAAIHDRGSTADERITGLLSTGGLVVGAYLGFRFTRGMDDGLDVLDGKPGKPDADDAPVALVGRSSAGRWGLGGLAVQPLSPALAPQHGLALQLVGAAF